MPFGCAAPRMPAWPLQRRRSPSTRRRPRTRSAGCSSVGRVVVPEPVLRAVAADRARAARPAARRRCCRRRRRPRCRCRATASRSAAAPRPPRRSSEPGSGLPYQAGHATQVRPPRSSDATGISRNARKTQLRKRRVALNARLPTVTRSRFESPARLPATSSAPRPVRPCARAPPRSCAGSPRAARAAAGGRREGASGPDP